MLFGYIIVVQSVHPTYFFASLRSNRTLEIQGKRYCGSGRGSAWESYLIKSGPEDLQAIAIQAKDEYHRNLKYALIDSLQSATKIVDWLNGNESDLTYEVVKVIVVRWGEKPPPMDFDSSFIGIDIDADGIYPIKEELFAAQISSDQESEFDEYFELLNMYGLFHSYENANRFVKYYLRTQDEKYLEILKAEEFCYCYLFHTNTEANFLLSNFHAFGD